MQFVSGDVQGEFVSQVRGRDPERCLVVPIDVGKRQSEVLVGGLATRPAGCREHR